MRSAHRGCNLQSENMHREDLIRAFLTLGMGYRDIGVRLARYGYIVSHQMSRRFLKSACLKRRKFYSDVADVVFCSYGENLNHLENIMDTVGWFF